LTIYAIAGRRIAGLFANPNAVRLKNRVTGGFLVLAGLSLLGYQRP
jgi:threonine/homoserine/homoserine lactone efflux protein